MVANDMMALGVVRAARAAKISIPEELSIVGFDDIALAALAEPPLTTVSIPREVLGRKALDALLATIESSRAAGRGNGDSHVAGDSRIHRPASVERRLAPAVRYRDDVALEPGADRNTGCTHAVLPFESSTRARTYISSPVNV